MNVPNNLLYSKEHEWVRIEGNKAFVGITDFAQNSLGDIVFVELPEIDSKIEAMSEAGVIESVKAVSPIYSPISGNICEINQNLEESPELLNSSPYDQFVFAVEMNEMLEKDALLNASEYEKLIEQA
ncbi:MAG: glycine cleavage system protein GcvH [Planctomycetia bacterium]|nr:glycine cleavage system protein GcvH [Planctomycetia bacterium]